MGYAIIRKQKTLVLMALDVVRVQITAHHTQHIFPPEKWKMHTISV